MEPEGKKWTERKRKNIVLFIESMEASNRAIKTQVPCGISFNKLMEDLK